MRADIFLFSRKYAVSRTHAKTLIGEKRVLCRGAVVEKASFDIDIDETDIVITVSDNDFISRAGHKLKHALDVFGVDPAGKTVVDIGASTGGFTDCLLRRGAAKIYCVDVGFGQLDARLRDDARIVQMEKTNARQLSAIDFDDVIDFAVMDVSFISQTLIYPALADILKTNAPLITLIKPQFEIGKQNIGKNGIARLDKTITSQLHEKIKQSGSENGFELQNIIDSPIVGGDGNREFLAYFVKL